MPALLKATPGPQGKLAGDWCCRVVFWRPPVPSVHGLKSYFRQPVLGFRGLRSCKDSTDIIMQTSSFFAIFFRRSNSSGQYSTLLSIHVQAQHFTMPAATHGMVDPDGPWRPSTSQRSANLSSQYYPSHPGTERVRSEQHLTSIIHHALWFLTSDSWLAVSSETEAAISDLLRGI